MGVVGRTVLGLALCAGSARAGDIYRSTDAAGRTVYSNGPGTPSDAGKARAPATSSSREGTDDFSTSASLRRQALERDLRASDHRLRDLDAQLATLARARTRNAGRREAAGRGTASARRTQLHARFRPTRDMVSGRVYRRSVAISASSSPSWRVIRKFWRTCSRAAAPRRAHSSGSASSWRARKAAPSTEFT